jgi:non-heme chloroperoxidase
VVLKAIAARAALRPASGRRLPALVPQAEYHEIEGGPHNIGWKHAEELNPIIAAFLNK